MSKHYQIQWGRWNIYREPSPSTTPSHMKYFNNESKFQNIFTSHIDNKYFWHFCWLPYLYTFSLYEKPSFIIVSAETEYISTRSWYRNINFKTSNKANLFIALVQYHISSENIILFHCSCIVQCSLFRNHRTRFFLFSTTVSVFATILMWKPYITQFSLNWLFTNRNWNRLTKFIHPIV